MMAERRRNSFEPPIDAAIDRWTAYTGTRFVKLDSASGVPINDPAAAPPATRNIRIGVFAFGAGGGSAAVGYSLPPNGGTGTGDILFNASAFYQIAPENEGDSCDTTSAPNDFEGLRYTNSAMPSASNILRTDARSALIAIIEKRSPGMPGLRIIPGEILKIPSCA